MHFKLSLSVFSPALSLRGNTPWPLHASTHHSSLWLCLCTLFAVLGSDCMDPSSECSPGAFAQPPQPCCQVRRPSCCWAPLFCKYLPLDPLLSYILKKKSSNQFSFHLKITLKRTSQRLLLTLSILESSLHFHFFSSYSHVILPVAETSLLILDTWQSLILDKTYAFVHITSSKPLHYMCLWQYVQ